MTTWSQLGYHAWWLYTGVIGAAIFLNIFSIFWAWKRRHALRRPTPNPSTKDGTSEASRSRGSGNGRISLRRLPISVLTASRIVAFRKRIPFVEGSLTEIVLSLAYFAALMGFALHDCRYLISICTLSQIDADKSVFSSRLDSEGPSEEGRRVGYHAVPSYCCSCHEEQRHPT